MQNLFCEQLDFSIYTIISIAIQKAFKYNNYFAAKSNYLKLSGAINSRRNYEPNGYWHLAIIDNLVSVRRVCDYRKRYIVISEVDTDQPTP